MDTIQWVTAQFMCMGLPILMDGDLAAHTSRRLDMFTITTSIIIKTVAIDIVV